MSRILEIDGYDRIMMTNFVNLSDVIGWCGIRETLQPDRKILLKIARKLYTPMQGSR
jgi:hypothetical protein